MAIYWDILHEEGPVDAEVKAAINREIARAEVIAHIADNMSLSSSPDELAELRRLIEEIKSSDLMKAITEHLMGEG
ncbi:hypothetical protein QA634_32355 [Methylobacterium sp. CB376]|uniref:hypothetical protein n=1 Tax=unclassified Methylobacterium TaxID=2615210 RepID=UPI0012375725|nr:MULTISPECIES: hypothetical protein [Methylobacterium]WFT79825.1 hypothetical protein QA634_32355 [Methylobacterium nodulans]